MNEAITLNGKPVPLAQTTLDQLVAVRVQELRGVAVAVNGAVVARGEWAKTRLHAGDQVEIVKIMVGG
jgi:sulfur carrier protein